jgi:serine/threonine protein phosphatase 1
MATYVMSDIHGCYDEMQQMLQKIGFSGNDRLIIAGDIIDRGRQNKEMLNWMMTAPENVDFLMGNHDDMFIDSVNKLCKYKEYEHRIKDAYMLAARGAGLEGFDNYQTIRRLINRENIRAWQFKEWADKMKTFPYVKELNINDRSFIIVHAGYPDEEKLDMLPYFGHDTVENFYLWARDSAIILGGRPNTTIISGHTPTISEGRFYNKGKVKKIVDQERNCVFYNIDCGCVFRTRYEEAALACIRLEDEEVFYV